MSAQPRTESQEPKRRMKSTPPEMNASSTADEEFYFTDERRFEKPVAWLLGRQFIGGLKDILLYTAYGTKLDPRDWMQANVYPFKEKAAALFHWRKRLQQQRSTAPQIALTEAKEEAQEDAEEAFWKNEKDGFWFDYLSDAGDGMRATYSLAYLCMSDLYINKNLSESLTSDANVNRQVRKSKPADDDIELPRGQFLFIGGDTAYHISDYMTLANRIQLPFKWAFKDLCAAGRRSEKEPRRPIFGIPGNHDYYDELDGFRRQFRRTVRKEPEGPATGDSQNEPQLIIEGFRRAQEASYIAIRMPYDWWLWGLDTEVGRVDSRQEKYFESLYEGEAETYEQNSPPKKLIVATCSPTTVFGKIADEEDEKAAGAFRALGLSINPFHTKKRNADGSFDFSETGDAGIEKAGQQCRLDLSGDVHYYARYWGPKGHEHDTHPDTKHKIDAPQAKHYASVVSGLGGAFHHPTMTYVNEVKEQVLYPDEVVSRRKVAKSIFNVKDIFTGGAVYLFGFILAFVLYFSSTVPQSSRQFLNNSRLFNALDITQLEKRADTGGQTGSQPDEAPEPVTPTVISVAGRENYDKLSAETLLQPVQVRPFVLWRALGLTPQLWPEQPPTVDQPRYFYDLPLTRWPVDMLIAVALIVLSLLFIIGVNVWFYKRLFAIKDEGSGEDAKEYDKLHRKLWVLSSVAAVMVLLGILSAQPYHYYITPFISSLLVLFTIMWSVAATALALGYSELLFKKAYKDYIHTIDWALPWALSILCVIIIGIGLWSFGRNTLPALIVSDILFVVVVGGLGLGMIGAAISKGGELLKGLSKYAGMGLVGVFHALLQIAVPFLLVRKGSPLVWALAIVLWIAFWILGTLCLSARRRPVYRWGLVLLWVVYGALLLALPYLNSVEFFTKNLPFAVRQPFAGGGWTGWWGLLPSFIAGLIGAVTCCMWFGWYLAVCFVFNGHNNEVGGAARIESYKQFIRFRLTENSLTGYVIAVNDVSMIGEPKENNKRQRMDGSHLKPQLIDVFQLSVRPE